jgi:hypothetical protein
MKELVFVCGVFCAFMGAYTFGNGLQTGELGVMLAGLVTWLFAIYILRRDMK